MIDKRGLPALSITFTGKQFPYYNCFRIGFVMCHEIARSNNHCDNT